MEEILHQLIDMVNIPLFIGFYTSQVVVWDFFHQQYDYELVDSPYGFPRPLTPSFWTQVFHPGTQTKPRPLHLSLRSGK